MATLDLAAIGKLTIKVQVMKEASALFTRTAGPSLVGATVVFEIRKGLIGSVLYTLTNGSGVAIQDADNMTITIPPLAHADYYYYKMVITYSDGSTATAVDKINTVYE